MQMKREKEYHTYNSYEQTRKDELGDKIRTIIHMRTPLKHSQLFQQPNTIDVKRVKPGNCVGNCSGAQGQSRGNHPLLLSSWT